MARSAAFTGIGTTRTAYFRSNRDHQNGSDPGASTGIGAGGDGSPTKGFRVASASANTTNVLVYVNGQLAGTILPGGIEDYVTIDRDGTANGGRLELAASSGTVSGSFGTVN